MTDCITIGPVTYRWTVKDTGNVELSTITTGQGPPIPKAVLIQRQAFVAVMRLAKQVWDKEQARQGQEGSAA